MPRLHNKNSPILFCILVYNMLYSGEMCIVYGLMHIIHVCSSNSTSALVHMHVIQLSMASDIHIFMQLQVCRNMFIWYK